MSCVILIGVNLRGKTIKYILCLVTLFLFSFQAQAADKFRYPPLKFSLTLDAHKFYGFFDKSDVFFPIDTSDIKHAGYGGNIGLELRQSKGLGVHILAGYQRIWYTDIGIAEVEKK